MSNRKFKPMTSIRLGPKSVTHSDAVEHYLRCDDPRDPHTVEHIEQSAPGCPQCKLIIHSRRMCDRKNCADTDCCSTAISVHCRSSGYDASAIFPFAVKIDARQCIIHVRCRYCQQCILNRKTLEGIVEDKCVIEEHIYQHRQKDETAVAFTSGTMRKFGAKSPVKMLDTYMIQQIFSLL